MKADWILIANAAHARLLEQAHDNRLRLLHTFEHTDSRKKGVELAGDKAGRELSGQSFGGAAYEGQTDTRRKEHQRFARELADHLEHEARSNAFGSLQVFASSPFLGELKQALGGVTQQLLAGTHDVDLTAVGPAELGPRIEQELAH